MHLQGWTCPLANAARHGHAARSLPRQELQGGCSTTHSPASRGQLPLLEGNAIFPPCCHHPALVCKTAAEGGEGRGGGESGEEQ